MSTNKPVGGAQFTPGPWVGYTNTDEGRHIISEAYAQDVIVCEQVHTDADISIIAAAPAMYEALVETMRVLRSLRDSKEEWYTLVTPELLNVWDRNKQAISQAEGRHHE